MSIYKLGLGILEKRCSEIANMESGGELQKAHPYASRPKGGETSTLRSGARHNLKVTISSPNPSNPPMQGTPEVSHPITKQPDADAETQLIEAV